MTTLKVIRFVAKLLNILENIFYQSSNLTKKQCPLSINSPAFNGVVRKPILMAINKLNRQNWNNITIQKIKLEDAQNRNDS